MTMSLRERRALIAGVLVIGLLLVFARGRPAWVEWQQRTRSDASDAIRRAREMDVAMMNLPATLDTLEARTARLSQAGAFVLSGDSPSDASSNFSALVAEAAHQSKIRLGSVSVRADTGFRELARIRIDFDGTADITGLSIFLSRIERGPTLVSMPRLIVRAANAESDTLSAEQLSLQMTLEAVAAIRPAKDSQ